MTPRRDLELTNCWLCAIASPADLARRLSTARNPVTADELVKLAKDVNNFRLFSIAATNGKSRDIQWPKRRLQALHKRIHVLLSRVAPPPYLHSTVRGRSYISNATAHDPSMPTIKIDIKKFYPSVTRASIFNFFVSLKCRRDVAGLLADTLTFDGHLPTGSSASPILAFYVFKPMFDEIATLAERCGLTMSCYVDDITLSGERAKGETLHEIRKIIARYGLKSHKGHIFASSKAKVITGVCNTPGERRVPNKLHQRIKTGFEDFSNAKTTADREKALLSLLGRLEAAGQIDPRFHARAITVRSAYRK